MDPSRSNSSVLISLAKPIPLTQVYDKTSTALEDSVKGMGCNITLPGNLLLPDELGIIEFIIIFK